MSILLRIGWSPARGRELLQASAVAKYALRFGSTEGGGVVVYGLGEHCRPRSGRMKLGAHGIVFVPSA